MRTDHRTEFPEPAALRSCALTFSTHISRRKLNTFFNMMLSFKVHWFLNIRHEIQQAVQILPRTADHTYDLLAFRYPENDGARPCEIQSAQQPLPAHKEYRNLPLFRLPAPNSSMILCSDQPEGYITRRLYK